MSMALSNVRTAQGSTSPLPLLALALATFGIGTTEFVIMGLLPDVSADLKVPIPKAGLLVTGYALSVAFGSPFVAIAISSCCWCRSSPCLL
jgi:DHA1 family inner membrane transport protein